VKVKIMSDVVKVKESDTQGAGGEIDHKVDSRDGATLCLKK